MPKRQMWSCDIGAQWRGQPVFHDARITLAHVELLAPGDNAQALLEPLDTALWTHVTPGMEFTVHEGRPVRGRVKVLERVEG